jgi:hypothetical protein
VRRQLLPQHRRIHEAEAALRTLNMKDLLAVRAAIEIMGMTHALAAPFSGLATTLERAARVLNSEGDAGTLTPRRRLADAKALILLAHEEIHVEDPHPQDDPRVN